MIAPPRHPRSNTPAHPGDCCARGRDVLLDVLTQYELWDDVIALTETADLWPRNDPWSRPEGTGPLAARRFAKGDREGGQRDLNALQAMAADGTSAVIQTSLKRGGAVIRRNDEAQAAAEELAALAAIALGDVREGLRLSIARKAPESIPWTGPGCGPAPGWPTTPRTSWRNRWSGGRARCCRWLTRLTFGGGSAAVLRPSRPSSSSARPPRPPISMLRHLPGWPRSPAPSAIPRTGGCTGPGPTTSGPGRRLTLSARPSGRRARRRSGR